MTLQVWQLAQVFGCRCILGFAAPIQGALHGYKDVNTTFVMTLISYWVIGLPVDLCIGSIHVTWWVWILDWMDCRTCCRCYYLVWTIGDCTEKSGSTGFEYGIRENQPFRGWFFVEFLEFCLKITSYGRYFDSMADRLLSMVIILCLWLLAVYPIISFKNLISSPCEKSLS